MRWLFSLLFITALHSVQALSSSGSRLLVVIEDTAEQGKYSKLWGDLRGAPAGIELFFSDFLD